MGLDNHWMKRKGEFGCIEGVHDVNNQIYEDSFRGKIFYQFVLDVTEVSLYGDPVTFEIPNETVKKMADDLEATEWRDSYIENYYFDEEGFRSLVKMFRLHADAGHYLLASY